MKDSTLKEMTEIAELADRLRNGNYRLGNDANVTLELIARLSKALIEDDRSQKGDDE